MRLTLLSHFIGRGGSTAFLVQLRDFFAARGHEVALLVGQDAPQPMAEAYRVVPSSRGQGWRERMRQYVRAVEETRPDVVYTISGKDEFEVLRFLRYPRALHCLCIESHEYADLPLWHRQLEAYTELRTAHTPDLLERIRGSGRYEIKLAYGPYRLSEEFLRAPDLGQSRPERPDDAVDVCYLARLDRFQKRSHWLPEIMRRCRSAGQKLHWHLYGSGPAEGELRKEVARLGLSDGVTFHGWQAHRQLAQNLGQHDLFFLCSRWEGLPAAMVEAMLCGLACVVPNDPGGMNYMVQSGGGWAYEALSPKHAAEALLNAVADRALLWNKRHEAQAVARALHDRKVIDGHLGHVEHLLGTLQFNGNACSLDTARRMKIVKFPVWLQRRWLEIRCLLRHGTRNATAA